MFGQIWVKIIARRKKDGGEFRRKSRWW